MCRIGGLPSPMPSLPLGCGGTRTGAQGPLILQIPMDSGQGTHTRAGAEWRRLGVERAPHFGVEELSRVGCGPTMACPRTMSPRRWHWDEARAEVPWDAPGCGQLGRGRGDSAHVVTAPNGAWRCHRPTRAAPTSSGSALGTGCCPRGPAVLLRSPPSPRPSVPLAGSAGDTGLAVPPAPRCWGTWGRARGCFWGDSRWFEYMSRSGFNYSNWVSEGRAGACCGSEGE